MNASSQATAAQILTSLQSDVRSAQLSHSKRTELLLNLKILGRDPHNVNSIYDQSGLSVVGHYAFGDYPDDISHEALRCIANSLLLLPQTRSTFISAGFPVKACRGLQKQNDDDEFLFSRILFLITYDPQADLVMLVRDHGLAEIVVQHLSRHAQGLKTYDEAKSVPPTSIAAMVETLKLFFNITNAVVESLDRFRLALSFLFDILLLLPMPEPPLQPPLSYVINALANIEIPELAINESSGYSVPTPDQYCRVTTRAIDILQKTLGTSTPQQMETLAIPLFTLLRGLNAQGFEAVREIMKTRLLPADEERSEPLGKSSSLPSQLLRLTTSVGLLNLPESVSALLFELSDNDASLFVNNVGYGYAAGYLMSHNIPMPDSAKQAGTAVNPRQITSINPITGQRLDKEEPVNLPEMTQEEKEREAERLYVLFERLKATGVIDVQNPVQQALQQGRFEEVVGSSDDEK